ncbi:MAG: ATPase domain-containing protein, partial [Trebonia sp.]
MAPSGKPAPERAGDRDKALEAALVQIERQFGKGSVMRLGDHPRVPIDVIPTGSIALDVALGLGGLPRGRIVEIYGPESSGKTTVALHALANAQKAGGIAAFIDAEHALDPAYAQKLGVDTDALLVSQPDTGEQALEIMDMLIRSGAIDVVVIDSVAALGQIEKQFGKGSVMRMGDNIGMNIESIPTGALSLDLALGIGGLPRGRIVEIYGPESSGKSTLAMHAVAEAQRNGGICAYIDAEHAMDPVYARAIGVNVDDLLISQPDTGEQALEIADMLIRS